MNHPRWIHPTQILNTTWAITYKKQPPLDALYIWSNTCWQKSWFTFSMVTLNRPPSQGLKAGISENSFKGIMVVTMVSSHQPGLLSNLRSSHLASNRYSCHAAIYVQVHLEPDEKHLLAEQVGGITLPASLRGSQAIFVSSILLLAGLMSVWCPGWERPSHPQILQFLPMGLHRQMAVQCHRQW